MKFICSLIVVEDINRAREFYEKIMGQSVVTDFGENVAFAGGFAIHQKEHFQNLILNNPILQKSNNFELYFESDEIDILLEKLKNENIEFIHEIKEQPWRQQVLRFYDYDKNIIEVGERMEHVAYRLYNENIPINEIAKITYLTEETINNSIKEYSESNL